MRQGEGGVEWAIDLGIAADELVAVIPGRHRRQPGGQSGAAQEWEAGGYPGSKDGLSPRESEPLGTGHRGAEQPRDRQHTVLEHQLRQDLHPQHLPQDRCRDIGPRPSCGPSSTASRPPSSRPRRRTPRWPAFSTGRASAPPSLRGPRASARNWRFVKSTPSVSSSSSGRCSPRWLALAPATAAATPMHFNPDDQACISDEHTVELTTEPHAVRLAGATPSWQRWRCISCGSTTPGEPPSRLARVTSRSRALRLDEALELGQIPHRHGPRSTA